MLIGICLVGGALASSPAPRCLLPRSPPRPRCHARLLDWRRPRLLCLARSAALSLLPLNAGLTLNPSPLAVVCLTCISRVCCGFTRRLEAVASNYNNLEIIWSDEFYMANVFRRQLGGPLDGRRPRSPPRSAACSPPRSRRALLLHRRRALLLHRHRASSPAAMRSPPRSVPRGSLPSPARTPLSALCSCCSRVTASPPCAASVHGPQALVLEPALPCVPPCLYCWAL